MNRLFNRLVELGKKGDIYLNRIRNNSRLEGLTYLDEWPIRTNWKKKKEGKYVIYYCSKDGRFIYFDNVNEEYVKYLRELKKINLESKRIIRFLLNKNKERKEDIIKKIKEIEVV
ncbi:MAG: hypothetical protein QXY18_05755 [Nitrososphaerota archaeon]